MKFQHKTSSKIPIGFSPGNTFTYYVILLFICYGVADLTLKEKFPIGFLKYCLVGTVYV